MLHGASETEPRGQRDAACCLRRQIAKIENDQSEASAFKQQVGGTQKLFQAMLGTRGILPTAHPQQPVQLDSSRRGRLRVESVAGIHQHAAFPAPGSSSKVVRPEEAGPQISVRQPRGRPPVRPSIAAMPLDTISGTGRTANREAGVTPASLASVAVEKARCGGRPSVHSPSVKSSAPEGCGQTSPPSSLIKTKRRPWAAEVETTAEDIDSSGKFQGSSGVESPAGCFAFYSPLKILRPAAQIVKLKNRQGSLRAGSFPVAYLGIHLPSKPNSTAVRPRCSISCSIQDCGRIRCSIPTREEELPCTELVCLFCYPYSWRWPVFARLKA